MQITIEDIINKYETNINPENMSKKLKEITVYTDEENIPLGMVNTLTKNENISINDIQKPKHETENGYEIYTYTFKDNKLEIKYKPENYRTMEVTLMEKAPDDVIDEYYMTNWTYNGTIGKVY